MPRPPPRALSYFAEFPIFRYEDFATAMKSSPEALARLLQYHQEQGRLFHIRRGVWTSRESPDPYALGTKLVRFGILAYRSALEFHGLGVMYGGSAPVTVLSEDRIRDFTWRGIRYRSVQPQRAVKKLPMWGDGVQVERGVNVTTVSRSFVDCLDRPDLGPKLIELWDDFRTRNDLDGEYMIAYALALKNRVTAARLGMFMQFHPTVVHRQQLSLQPLRDVMPKTLAQMDPSCDPADAPSFLWWNLGVPTRLMRRLQDR